MGRLVGEVWNAQLIAIILTKLLHASRPEILLVVAPREEVLLLERRLGAVHLTHNSVVVAAPQ